MNDTIQLYKITEACFDWCRLQHFDNEMRGITLVMIALVLIFIWELLYYAKPTEEYKAIVSYMMQYSHFLAALLLAGFLLMTALQRKGIV